VPRAGRRAHPHVRHRHAELRRRHQDRARRRVRDFRTAARPAADQCRGLGPARGDQGQGALMHGLTGKIRAVPGKRAELAAVLVMEDGAMPGCLSYVVAEDPQDADVLWVTEVWTDEAAHRASLQLDSVKAAIA